MIDTKALRSKILDAAVRGQLTQQLPEDGTAEELYQQIQKEKQKLIESGKIKKEKPLPEIKEEEIPFEIPENWKWVRLGELFQHNTGKALNSSDKQGTLLEYITTSNLYWDRFELKELKKMFFTESEIDKCTVKKGDLLVCEGGDIGRSAIWSFDYEMRIQNHIHRLRKYSSFICTEFYYYLLLFYKLTGRINGIGIGLQGLSSNRVHSLIVPLVPFNEAVRIVEKVSQTFSVRDEIDKLQKWLVDNLVSLKSKLINSAIQGKLTEQLPEDGTAEELYQQIQKEKQKLIEAGKIKKEKPQPEIKEEEIPFKIPKNWKWVRLGSTGITITGGTPAKSHPEFYGGDYPFFKPSDLDAGRHITVASEYLTEEGKNVSRQLLKGSILVCCIGSIGKCAIIDTEGTVNQQINALTPILCNSDYLLYAIDSEVFNYQLNQEARATTVSIINKSKFDNCILPLPPLSEQRRIVERLDELLEFFSS